MWPLRSIALLAVVGIVSRAHELVGKPGGAGVLGVDPASRGYNSTALSTGRHTWPGTAEEACAECVKVCDSRCWAGPNPLQEGSFTHDCGMEAEHQGFTRCVEPSPALRSQTGVRKKRDRDRETGSSVSILSACNSCRTSCGDGLRFGLKDSGKAVCSVGKCDKGVANSVYCWDCSVSDADLGSNVKTGKDDPSHYELCEGPGMALGEKKAVGRHKKKEAALRSLLASRNEGADCPAGTSCGGGSGDEKSPEQEAADKQKKMDESEAQAESEAGGDDCKNDPDCQIYTPSNGFGPSGEPPGGD